MALNASAGESVPPGGIVLSLWEGISSTPLGGRIQNRFIFVTVIVIVIAITALVVEPGEKCLDQANREWFYIFGYTASPFFYFHRIAWSMRHGRMDQVGDHLARFGRFNTGLPGGGAGRNGEGA